MKKLLVLSGLIIFLASGCAVWLWNTGGSLEAPADKHFLEEKEQAEEAVMEMALLSESGYYYSQLTTEEKALYVKILQALQQGAADVPMRPEIQEKTFNKVFQCVLNDHPEIFYVDGFTIISYKKDGIVSGQAFSGSYLYNQKEIAERKVRIEEAVQGILKEIPSDSSEYEKVRYVYEYLVRNTEYVLDSADNQNICSVFLNGQSVCQGYAKAMQYLLKQLGMNALFVSGIVENGEEHAWNIVQIDGAYYHVDVTWGDASYVASGSSEAHVGKIPQINYEYLCVPDEQLFRTHTIYHEVPLPVCESIAANYYVVEGAYFTEADLEKAKKLFEKAYEKRSEYVTLKCADQVVYEALQRSLIEQQKVFQYLHPAEGQVAYTANEQQLTLSFWLQD